MTIQILDTRIITDAPTGTPTGRHVDISITDGNDTYRWSVGGLPLTGDLQPILDSREAELWAVASVRGKTFDVFEASRERRLLKALAFVIMDEINILRNQHGLALRNEGQIRTAIKNKLAGMQ